MRVLRVKHLVRLNDGKTGIADTQISLLDDGSLYTRCDLLETESARNRDHYRRFRIVPGWQNFCRCSIGNLVNERLERSRPTSERGLEDNRRDRNGGCEVGGLVVTFALKLLWALDLSDADYNLDGYWPCRLCGKQAWIFIS